MDVAPYPPLQRGVFIFESGLSFTALQLTMTKIVYSRIPAQPVVQKPLIVRQIAGKDYYWSYREQRWVRLTRRCPLL